MNSLQRIQATLNFKQADSVPVIPQIFAHSAIFSGRTLLDYVTSAETAATCQLQALQHYQGDAVFSAIDVCIEAEAMGASVRFRRDIYPAVETPPFVLDQSFEHLPLPDPQTAARMPQVLQMAKHLRQAVGDETLVVGVVQGPMTLTLQFLGPETALYLAIDEPLRFEQLLDFGTEVAIRFGLAQLQAGVHLPMVFEPASCSEIVPVAFFRELIAPRLQRIFNAFKQGGALANWLHIAGKTLPILPQYANLGVDIGNFDYCVDPLDLQQTLSKHKLCVDGNIKPLLFVDGTSNKILPQFVFVVYGGAPRTVIK